MAIIETDDFKLSTYVNGNHEADKLALVLPGLLDSKDYPHIHSHVDYLAEQGYLAVSFDMPGTWESGDDINQYLMTNSLLAIKDVINFYNKPTLLVGHSNGGRLALLASAQNASVNGCVAIMSAPTFVRENNYYERMVVWKESGIKTFYRDLPGEPDQKRRFDVPFAFCQDANKYDVREVVKDLAIPKLFIAGTNDTIVTIKEVKQNYDAASEPKEYATINSDHHYRRHPNLIQEVNKLIGNFIENQ